MDCGVIQIMVVERLSGKVKLTKLILDRWDQAFDDDDE